MISTKSIGEHARRCKQYISSKLGEPSKVSLKDLKLLITCRVRADFTPIFTTSLYTKQKREYPLALQYIDTISEKELYGTSINVVNIKFTLGHYEKVRGRWKLVKEASSYVDSSFVAEHLKKNTGNCPDNCKLSIKYISTRFGKMLEKTSVISMIQGVSTNLLVTFDYSNASEYYPQQNIPKKRGGHQYV